MKQCTKCNQNLPLSAFYKDKNRYDGLYPRCKECHKATMRIVNAKPLNVKRRRASKYGLTINQLDNLPTTCEVCGSSERLCVDHCHTNLNVRGVLCFKCNAALGLLNDDVTLLQNLIKYLQK